MSQISQPDLDVYTGGWRTPPVYSKINDTHPHDDTFVSSEGRPEGDAFKVHFKGLMAPQAGDQVLTVRMQKVGTGSEHVWMSLVESKEGKPTVVIAARRVDPTDVYADYSLTLTTDETKRISDYACLYLRVSAVQDDSSSSSSGSTSRGSVSNGSTSGGSVSGGSTSGGSASAGSSAGSASSAGPSGSSSNSSMSNGTVSYSNSGSSVSGNSSSSRSSSSSGVIVGCCPNPIPMILFVTFSEDIAPLGTVELTFDGSRWSGTASGCGGVSGVRYECIDSVFLLNFSGNLTSGGGGPPQSCEPFFHEFPIPVGGGTCGVNGYATITETPP